MWLSTGKNVAEKLNRNITESGLYYLQSRYYDPETGRFLNADAIAILSESRNMINGLNLFMYCSNNPVMLVDYSGMGWWQDLWNNVKNFFVDLGNAISNAVGGVVNFSKQITNEVYNFFYSISTGIGYNLDFGNNKPINFFLNKPDQWWKFWEYSVGVDININGYGFGISIGGENSISIHCGNTSIDIGFNIRGQVFLGIATQDKNGLFAYTRYSLNLIETGLFAVLAYYTGRAIIPALIPAFA